MGAKGLICMSNGKQRHKMIITPVWGTPAFDDWEKIPRLHTVSISKLDGSDLIDWAKRANLRQRFMQKPLKVGEKFASSCRNTG